MAMAFSDQSAGLADHRMAFRVVSCSRTGWERHLLYRQVCRYHRSRYPVNRAFPCDGFDEVELGELERPERT
jgi:hypothetical protein